MLLRRQHAALAATVLACAWAVPAAAQTGEEQPPLTEDPPTELETPTPTATPQPEDDAADEAAPRTELAETGNEPLLVALAGLGLVGAGAGLRLRLADGG